MADQLLSAIEIETAANPDAAVIWMHGLGDDGNGWSQIVAPLNLPPALRVRFIFPHAPVIPVTINRGMTMRAWYDITDTDLNNRADMDGVRRSQGQVEAFIARERTRGIDDRRIVLAGFSQGGAIALYAGLRHPQRLAGIVAMSTYLIDARNLFGDASRANRDVPILMAHGTRDPVVQFAWADVSKRKLIEGGWAVDWHTYPMEHSAVLEEIVTIGHFITRVLAPVKALD